MRRDTRRGAATATPSGAVAWHVLTVGEAAARLGSDALRGLDDAEAARRLAAAGPNRIAEQARRSRLALLWAQFQDFMVLVLLGAAGISGVLGEVADAIAILAIVAINACLGYLQETRAERSLDALRLLTAPSAHVLRAGAARQIPAQDVVPGDLLLLAAGDRVAADARLVEARALEAEESALTGESAPVAKAVAALSDARLQLGDRLNMVFQGTHVTRGSGHALVTATGMETEVGRIAGLIGTAGEAATPLQRRLDRLGRALVVACLLLSALVVLSGVLRGEDPYRMFLRGARSRPLRRVTGDAARGSDGRGTVPWLERLRHDGATSAVCPVTRRDPSGSSGSPTAGRERPPPETAGRPGWVTPLPVTVTPLPVTM